MNLTWWRRIDGLAHFLYEPFGLGRRAYRVRWWHRIHLIPGRILARVCDRLDRAAGMDDNEEDWTEEEFDKAMAEGEPATLVGVGATNHFVCQHMTMTGTGLLWAQCAWGCSMARC